MQKKGFPKEKCIFVQKMHFPTERCAFLQKNAFTCRKMRFWGGHMARDRRKSQEGLRAQESRTLANFHKRISAAKSKFGFIVSSQNGSQLQPYSYHKKKNRPPVIWTSLWAPLAIIQRRRPYNETLKNSLRTRGTKPERGCIRMFARNENRNEGTFAFSPGTRVHSPKTTLNYETALLQEEDKRAATNVQHGFVLFFLLSFSSLLFPLS